MKLILLLLYTISFKGILSQTVNVNDQCECDKIKTNEECKINCQWNFAENKCEKSTVPLIRTSYCSYLREECNKTIGCGNYSGICVPFTGCTSITFQTNQDCQQYSELCITDGQKCVERSVCEDYKTRLSCRNKYIENKWSGFCHWDNNNKKCRDVEQCHELSFTLKNDAECRNQFSWCTYKMGGGCEVSGEQCKDQRFEQQCITNKKGTVKCTWDGEFCHDFTCKNITKDCIKNGCSLDKDSNCMDRLECDEYTNQQSCTYNKQNVQCMWEDKGCRIKSCENASTKRQTNQQCQEIDSKCITKFEGGCKTNGECEDANTNAGCEQNISGQDCYWNGYECVIKQCQLERNINKCKEFLSNCVLNNEMCIESGCYEYSQSTSCNGNKQCQWLDQCDIKTCESAGNSINFTTHQDCYNYLETCTLKDTGIGCMLMKYSCDQYSKKFQCYQSTKSKCTWLNNLCVESKCEHQNYKTHDECNNYLNTCTTNGTECIQLQQKCSQYTKIQSCNINSQNEKCFWENNKCIDITCDRIPKNSNFTTHEDCYNYSSKRCTVLESITGCIPMPSDCSLLTFDQCQGKKCIWSLGICRVKQCNDYKGNVNQSICLAFIEGNKCMRGPGLIPNKCVDRVQQCSQIDNEYQCNEIRDSDNNRCQWQYSFCIQWSEIIKQQINGNCPEQYIPINEYYCKKNKECTDKDIAPVDYTDEICENYLINCKKDTTKQCIEKQNYIKSDQCEYYVSRISCNEQPQCYWQKDNKCAKIEANCNLLLNKDDCQNNRDTSGTMCIWQDPKCLNICDTLTPKNSSCSNQDSKCVILGSDNKKCTKKFSKCSDYTSSKEQCEDDDRCIYTITQKCIEKQCSDITESDVHDDCSNYKSDCTISYLGGCSDLQPNCSDYKTSIQCHLNNKSKACYWSEYTGCKEQKCSEIVYEPDKGVSKCLTFFKDLICNVNEGGNACEDLKDSCTKYLNEKQCQKQFNGNECQWKENKCQEAICQFIVMDNYSHQDCYNKYTKLKCTVDENNKGCSDLYYDCKRYKTQESCQVNTLNEVCVWDQTYQQCKFKSCKDNNKPQDQKCSDYLSSCIEPQFQCRQKICEDYQLYNDEDCRKQDQLCTSNGRFCIQRGTCEQSYYEQACNIDINNKLCNWNSGQSKCNYTLCNDAPSSIQYTDECEKYFPQQNCVAKYGGGCLIITGCFDYTIEKLCEESKLFDCIWENNICRIKQCTDYKFTFVSECKQKNCTTDGVSCVDIKDCAQLTKQSCYFGTDGMCIYLNNRCQPYKNCQSINYNNHQECYDNLQNQCTTNGTQCIPLTFCSEYTLQISCVIGIDGECAWKNSQCSKFTSCEDYEYTTHDECNSVNQGCTTDTQKKCIKLKECINYEEQNCKLDKNKTIKKDGQIQKLDQCVWKNKQCQNVTCADLYGLDHNSCNKQLYSCTSNGNLCIQKEKQCSSYSSNEICEIAYSEEGRCTYVNSQCQLIDCSTKPVEVQCKTFQHCQFINNQCQSYKKCQEYQVDKDCTMGTDGQCIFKVSKCKLMTDCADANTQQLCSTKSCFWNDTSSKCENHNCQTYAKQNSCGLFYNYQKTTITYCSFDEQKRQCVETDPSTFTDFCFLKSLGYYSNNNGTCQFCKNQTTINQPPNGGNESNGEEEGIHSIIYDVTIIIGLLIII